MSRLSLASRHFQINSNKGDEGHIQRQHCNEFSRSSLSTREVSSFSGVWGYAPVCVLDTGGKLGEVVDVTYAHSDSERQHLKRARSYYCNLNAHSSWTWYLEWATGEARRSLHKSQMLHRAPKWPKLGTYKLWTEFFWWVPIECTGVGNLSSRCQGQNNLQMDNGCQEYKVHIERS